MTSSSRPLPVEHPEPSELSLLLSLLRDDAFDGQGRGWREQPLTSAQTLPQVPGEALLWARERLRSLSPSPLARAQVLALLLHGWKLEPVAQAGYDGLALLSLSSLLSLPLLARWLRAWPEQALESAALRREAADELELFARDRACWGESLSPWISEESLEAAAAGSPNRRESLVNAMRHLRLEVPMTDTWMAESQFPRVTRHSSAGCLLWTVGAPLATQDAERWVSAEVVVETVDFLDAGRPSNRRAKMAAAVGHHLRLGRRVLCVGNHSTVESRRRLLSAAREEGARSEAIYFDFPLETLSERNAQAGWPASLRTLEHTLEGLEAPRPHEAEAALIVGEAGIVARWRAEGSLLGGFVETLS